MSLLTIAQTLRAAWDELFKHAPKSDPIDPYVTHLEDEIKYLREQNQILSTKLDVAKLREQHPVAIRRDPPKLTAPPKTKWDQYLEEDMARQEAEAQAQKAEEVLA